MENNNRYARQILLKEFGEAAQKKLLNAKVLVIQWRISENLKL